MTRMTNVSSKAQVKNAGGSDITDDIGYVESASYTIRDNAEDYASVNGGTSYQYTLDGVCECEATLSIACLNFKCLQLMGTYSAGWSVALDDSLPVHTFSMATESDKTLAISGFKFGRAVIRFSKDEKRLLIDFEGKGLAYTISDSALSPQSASTNPVTSLELSATLGGTAVGSVASGSISYDREIEAVRGIEATSAGNQRKPTEVIEKMKNIDFDLEIEVTDSTPWTKATGDASFPLVVQDTRSDTTLVLTGSATQGSISLSGVRVNEITQDAQAGGDIVTVRLSGTAKGATIAGS